MGTPARIDQITAAAEGLFGRQGYHRTTMRQLAGELDIQGASLYAHIESKEALLSAIVARAAQAFDEAFDGAEDAEIDAESRFRLAVAAHIGVITANLSAARVYFQDWRHLSQETRSDIRSRRDGYEARWRRLIAQGVEEGVFRSTDTAMAARLCLSTCNWVYQWYDTDGKLSPDEVARLVSDLLLNGVRDST